MPNIIVIMTDDQPADSLQYMHASGIPGVKGRLMSRGPTFLNSFTVASQCEPSRASLLSGQYAHNHGLYSNIAAPPHGYGDLDQSTLLPVWLQAAGYKTCHVGKYLNGWGAGQPIPPGYDEWYGQMTPNGYFEYDLNENGATVHYGSAPADYSTAVYASKAAAFIAAQASSSQPFFLFVGFQAPHEPATGVAPYAGTLPATMTAPRNPNWGEATNSDKPAYVRNLPALSAATKDWIDERYRRRNEALQSINNAVETIVLAMLAAGKKDTTYIIYTSDNGYMQGEHRIPHNKNVPYEESIKVPLIICGPGTTEMTRRELVANIDLTATIVEWAGATPTRVLDGKSLVPMLATTAPVAHRGHLLVEFMEDWVQNYGGGGAPAYTVPAYAGLRSHEWKYVKYPGTGEAELYDMLNDPYELLSRHADPSYATVKADLDALLAGAAACVGSGCHF